MAKLKNLDQPAKVKNYSDFQNEKGATSLLIARIASYVFLAFVTIMCLFSFYLLIINSTRSNAGLQQGFSLLPREYFLQNFASAMASSTYYMPRGLLNSLIVAASTSIVTVYFSAMTAYGLFAYDFKGRKLADKFILLVMMIPTQVSTVGFVTYVRQLRLVDTYWPLIIPAIAAPATYFYMKQYIEGALPLEVVEAARVDGSNEFRTFNTICLPMLKPALAVQMIFAFVASWNNFFTPALILDKAEYYTTPIMISLLKSELTSQAGDLGKVYMSIFVSIVPVIIVYIFLSKFIIKGVTLGSVKG
ncbi:MAG: carbohydrate ABC transporter permease [Ruminiclostridium sp.]|nr:carbohydrate ABC transporter permease [Ruminiclostridium sp.]